MSLGQAMTRPHGVSLARIAALLGAVLTLTLPVAAISAQAAAPAYTLEERAQAIAQPSVVFTELVVNGVVRDKKNGRPVSPDPVVVSIRCSAVVVNSTGIAMSTRYCVSPTHQHVNDWAFNQLANREINNKRLAEGDKQRYVQNLNATADYTAVDSPSEPSRQLAAQIGDANAGKPGDQTVAAEVLSSASDNDSGFSVIKLAKTSLPAVEFSGNAGLPTGTPFVAIGYGPAASGAFESLAYTSSATGIKVTSSGPNVPKSYKFTGTLPIEWRGGAVVDLDGRLAGGLLWSDTAYDTEAVRAALKDANVSNEISEADRTYRRALDDYFAGRYSSAIKKFDTVILDSPANSLAGRYRALAVSRQAIENGDSPTGVSMPTWVVVLISALAGALISAIVVLMTRRRHRVLRPHEDSLLPVSVNPFAPTSGPGAYPTSGAGYAQYPTADYPVVDPLRPDVPRQAPTVLEIPQPAPPDVPVPYPPIPLPREPQRDVSAADPQSEFEAEAGLPLPPMAAPAAPPAVPVSQPAAPEFSWPDDDGPASQAEPENPWAPSRRRE